MEKDIQYTNLLKQQISTFQKEKRFLEFKSNYQDVEKLGKYTKMRKSGIITTAEKKRWKLTDEFKRTLSENK